LDEEVEVSCVGQDLPCDFDVDVADGSRVVAQFQAKLDAKSRIGKKQNLPLLTHHPYHAEAAMPESAAQKSIMAIAGRFAAIILHDALGRCGEKVVVWKLSICTADATVGHAYKLYSILVLSFDLQIPSFGGS
jgi:hypothetical protein